MDTELVINSTDVRFGDARLDIFYILDRGTYSEDPHIPLSAMFHTHLRYELHTAASGKVTIHYKDRDVCITQGEALLIPANTEHFTTYATNTEDSVLGITLTHTDGMHGFYNYFLTTMSEYSNLPIKFPQELVSLITNYSKNAIRSDLKSMCRLKASAYSIAVLIFESLNGFDSSGCHSTFDPPNSEPILILLETLVDRIDYPLTQIANDLGYSVRHTLRLIQKTYGKNLHEIRSERMINSAKKILLEQPSAGIQEIASRSGFPSASAMRRAFVKNGLGTPSQFRKSGGK